jgi:outer membrane protein OmpA-like peptidoglycan-associated protein/tetratricopeptide (TPR) repeat protein
MRFKILFTLLTIFIYSCASAQPQPDSGTKNKKAKDMLSRAVGEFKAGQFKMCLETVNDVLKKDDKYIDAWMLKGDVLAEMQLYDEAEKCFDAVFAINAEYLRAYLAKAKVQVQAQKYKEAKENLDKFMSFPYAEKFKKDTDELLAICEFAVNSRSNPVPFNPINLGPAINTMNHEYFPGLTADEQRLYFTRLSSSMNEDFYESVLKDSVWQKATNMGAPVNTPENEGFVSVSADGQYIFFTACNRNDTKGSCDLYFCKLDGDQWSTARNLEAPINTSAWESQPSLSYDGANIYFSSNRPGGFGGSDIWMTTFDVNHFTEPVNLGPNINTEKDEQCPFIHTDNNTLYFSSEGWPGMGKNDIYFSKRDAEGNWQKPTNIGYPINTPADEIGLIVNRGGNWAYFASDMPGGYGGLDIYGFELYPAARPEARSYAKGVVFDAETNEKLQANVELIDLETGKTIMYSRSNKKSGEFLMVLQPNKNYMLNVNKEGYVFYSENFSLKEFPSDKPFVISVPLYKLKIGGKVVLKNVFFDTDKFDLKDESKAELNKLVALLKAQPKVKAEIGGHTDNTGNKQKNITLSQNRAKAVYDYLVTNGIDAARLTYKGYGDSKPVATNATEEGRHQNRRTEFVITGN